MSSNYDNLRDPREQEWLEYFGTPERPRDPTTLNRSTDAEIQRAVIMACLRAVSRSKDIHSGEQFYKVVDAAAKLMQAFLVDPTGSSRKD